MIDKIKWCCPSILPLQLTDYTSDSEIICVIIKTLNYIIENANKYPELIPDIVLEEIQKVIDSGKFTALIQEWINKFPILSIKDFGAKGDGVTDDTESFLNAISTNNIVLFPEGNYLINARTFDGDQDLDVHNKILLGVDPSLSKITVKDNYLFFSKCSNITLKNLSFEVMGDKVTTPVGFWKHHGLIIDNCDFSGGTKFSLQCANTDDVYITNSKFHDCGENSALNMSTDANLVHGEFSQKNIYIENCEFYNGGLDGAIINNDNVTMINCNAHDNGIYNQAAGFYANSMKNHRYISCRADDNTGNGFDFVKCNNVVVDSCQAIGNNSAGIFFGQSEFISIVNNYCENNGNQPVEVAQDSGIAFKESKNSKITNNVCRDARVNPFQSYGLRMSVNCLNAFVGMNTFTPNKSGDIYSKTAYNKIDSSVIEPSP